MPRGASAQIPFVVRWFSGGSARLDSVYARPARPRICANSTVSRLVCAGTVGRVTKFALSGRNRAV